MNWFITVRQLSTEDKPGTLPVNLYAHPLPKQPLHDMDVSEDPEAALDTLDDVYDTDSSSNEEDDAQELQDQNVVSVMPEMCIIQPGRSIRPVVRLDL